MFFIRHLNRHRHRGTLRHTTRMLGGAHRPRPPNYLALASSAIAEVIKLDKRLRPFMLEQRQRLEQWRLNQEIEAALRKVYGDAAVDEHLRQSSA